MDAELKHIIYINILFSLADFGVPFHVKCLVPCRSMKSGLSAKMVPQSRLVAVQHANAPRHKGLPRQTGID